MVEIPEVLGSARADISSQSDLDTASGAAANRDIEKDNRVGHGMLEGCSKVMN